MPTASQYRRITALFATLLILSCTFPRNVIPQEQKPMPPASTLTKEQKEELDALFKEARDAYTRRDYQAALSAYQKALQRAEQLNAPLYSGTFLGSLGNVYSSLGQKDKALDYYTQALELYRKNNANPLAIATTLANLGNVYSSLGQKDKALDFYNQALELFQKNNAQPLDIANTLTVLGNMYKTLDENDKALGYYNQALELFRKNNSSPLRIADTLYNLGNVYSSLGQKDKALDFLSQALELKRKNDAGPLDVTGILHNLGLVYITLGQNDKALDLLNQALEIQRKNNARPFDIAQTLQNLGVLYHKLNQNDKALDVYTQALELYRKNNANPLAIATTLANLGNVYSSLGQKDKALDFHTQALELKRKNNASPLSIALSLNSLGVVYYRIGEHEKGFGFFTQALEIQRKNNASLLDIAQTLQNLGNVLRTLNRLDEAEKQFVECLKLRETLSYQVGDPSQVGALQESFHHFYENYAHLLLDRERPQDALEMLERGRGQGLARQIDLSERRDITTLFTEEERKNLTLRTQALRTALTIQRRRAQEVENASETQRDILAQRKKQADHEVQQAQQEYTLFYDALFARYPQLRDIAENRPAKFTRLMTLTEANPRDPLSKDTLYLEYGFVDNETMLLFALGNKDGFKPFTLSLNSRELVTTVQKWREALELSGGRGVKNVTPGAQAKAASEEKAMAQQAYRMLLGEVEKAGLLAPGRYKRLVIVGSDPLLEIPLAALCDSQGKRLVERYSLARALSLSIAFWRTNPLQPKAFLLCIADPTGNEDVGVKPGEQDQCGQKPAKALPPPSTTSAFRAGFVPLPGAREEGHAVATLFEDARLLVGPEAKEEKVLKLLPDYRILHFATHGFLAPNDVRNSGLVLANEPSDSKNDGMLSARKLFNLPLSAQLAVLSACETGRGQSQGGEGLMGLVWAFRASGVPSVVASQWQVDDAATKQLMVAFYQALKSGKSKDEALRLAMLSILKDGNTKHASPYYWAAFELIGDTSPIKLDGISGK